MQVNSNISFQDTATAFAHKTDKDLGRARLLFRSFDYPILLKWGPGLAKIAVSLGFKFVIKDTIFKQFCGGENIQECNHAIQQLAKSGIGTILDYSVEGEESELVFVSTAAEIKKTIDMAHGNASIPFAVFKVTGIIDSHVLEKVSSNIELSESEQTLWDKGKARFFDICYHAQKNDVRLFIDAEESWIQLAIDQLAEQAMGEINTTKAIIYNTVQLYRHDRLAYLKDQIKTISGFLGFKLVRGAYMEKERARAIEFGYQDPIQPNKESTDSDYNEALKFCIENSDKVSICVGTHNENSSMLGVQLMAEKGLDKTDTRVYFSQLLGMSDHISFNLSHSKYNVAKYVPYGPVNAVIPYLTRRAQENSSVAGQMGRELELIDTEIKRRRNEL
jgi:proline dehydrogenase